MIKRNAYDLMKQWADREDRKPLVLRGARQVGKTTLVDSLGESFDTYLRINPENEDAADLFERKGSIDDLI